MTVTAISALINVNNLVKDSGNEAAEALRKQTDELKEATVQAKERETSAIAEAEVSAQLLDRLKALLQEKDRDEAKTKELLFVVKSLNEANDGLNLSYNEQTNALNMSIAAIDDYMAKKKELIMLQALEENALEMAKKIADAEVSKNVALKEQEKIVARMSELFPIVTSPQVLDLRANEEYYKLLGECEELNRSIQEANDTISTSKPLYEEYMNAVGETAVETDGLSKSTDNATAASNEYTKAQERQKKAVEEQEKAIEEEQKALDKSISSYDNLTKTLDAVTSGQSLTYSGIMNLIQQYPQLATQIQKTKDGYTIQEEALRLLAQAELDAQIAIQESALARAIAAEEEARRSIDAKMAIASANHLATKQILEDGNAELEQIQKSQEGLEHTIKMMKELREDLNNPWTPTKTGGGKKEEESPLEKQRRENLEAYNAQMEDLKWHLEMEYITEEEYYAKRDELAKRYLEEGSKEWKAYMLDRKKYNDDIAKDELKAAEDAEKEKICLYNQGVDDAKYARATSTKDALDAEDEYYTELRRLRNEFLTEGTKEYQDATIELINHYGSLAAVEAGIVEESTARFNAAMKDDQRNITEHYGDTIDGQKAFIEAYKKNRDTFLKEGTEAWEAANDAIAQLEKDLADDIEAEWKRIEDARRQAEDEAQQEHDEWIASMKDSFDRGRRELEYKRDMDLITEEEFYKRLRELQQEYLWHPELLDDSRGIDVEIYQWEKRMKEAAERAREEALRQQEREIAERAALAKKEAQAAYDERVKQIKKELDLEKDRLDQIIQNIDDELAARDKLKDEEDYAKRLAKLQMDIEYERNAENRIELEKELLRLQQEREDELYREQKEAEKQAIQDQKDVADALADRQITEAERARDALLKQYEEIYAVMVEQLTGKPRETPLTAIQNAYDAVRQQIENNISTTINNSYQTPITAITAVTAEMIAAAVRNELERILRQ